MFLASLIVALVALPGVSPAQDQPVAIIFPPWLSADEAITRSLVAGHSVLRSGRSGFIVIVAPAAENAGPARRPQGAVMMTTLAGLAGCLDSTATLGSAS